MYQNIGRAEDVDDENDYQLSVNDEFNSHNQFLREIKYYFFLKDELC